MWLPRALLTSDFNNGKGVGGGGGGGGVGFGPGPTGGALVVPPPTHPFDVYTACWPLPILHALIPLPVGSTVAFSFHCHNVHTPVAQHSWRQSLALARPL
jgi:hypothetical protein